MKMMRWRSSRRLSSGRSGRSEICVQRRAAAAELEIPQETGGISAEERLDLYSAIERLPEKYRTVVILRYFDELKLDEIAYITGVPRGTVSGWLTRARQELRNILKEGYLNE